MNKVRIYEVAKQLNLEPKAVVALFQTIGFTEVRNHMSSVEAEAVERVKRHLEKQRTHHVVEERIRPTVVKRKAVSKEEKKETLSSPPPSLAVFAQAKQGSSKLSRPVSEVQPVATSQVTVAGFTESKSSLLGERLTSLPQEIRDHGEKEESSDFIPSAGLSYEREKEGQKQDAAEEIIPVEGVVQASSAQMDVIVREQGASCALPTTSQPVQQNQGQETDGVDQSSVLSPSPVEPSSKEEDKAVKKSASVVLPQSPSCSPTVQRTGVEYWSGRPGVSVNIPVGVRSESGDNFSSGLPRRVQYDPKATGSEGSGASRRGMVPQQQVRSGLTVRGRGTSMMRKFSSSVSMRKVGEVASSTKAMSEHKKVIRIEENITLQGMAAKMSVKATELLVKLLSMGMTGVHINTTLDADTAKLLASEFGWEVENMARSEEQNIAEARGEIDLEFRKDGQKEKQGELRAPVVAVMGHVDHGKTTLLDRIRKANVAGGEAGGITQHIGAYRVNTSHGVIVFLDTPGHEAFTQMRARGASITDIVVLVVAADDGVMPQTEEAVNHAKAAGVPVIVAVNKMDKSNADLERVKRELVELGLQPEEWGGDTIFVPVSAQTGEGIDHLLEMLSIQAEVLELKANAKKVASGTVIEALLDRGRGPVARVLIQDGTLRRGDFVLAGPGFGKVRAMTNEHGKQVNEAGPSTPVEILGLSEVPGAGDPLHAVKDPKKAQEIAEARKGKISRSLAPATAKVSLEELSKWMADSLQHELRVIVKGDVQGSIEAVADALSKLTTEKARLSIVHAGVGAITEGDVNLAIASRAIILGFNVRAAGKAVSLAEEGKVEIRFYTVIYNILSDIRLAMEGLLPPTYVERAVGKGEIRQVFKIKEGTIAGCYITQGCFKRGQKARLLRDDCVMWNGKIGMLKRFKEDVKEVQEGFECGVFLEGFSDIKERDVIDCYEIDEVKQKLW
ncbi:translation initiation factor IF-2 [Pajaroellobacter abortibovis]|uniref:Translation initiation factor IF-2 n=1 Tax=Pajaroellobacter abortibovis TaxID=1882918 RepID=A0A1L6MVF3_9BACT|nr:translation initiation factor IF-2 [Pajaroellobacter abortibovis]APR99496.1 translation initiation factor IF-2 [Pajaroellobacter abortibovis]